MSYYAGTPAYPAPVPGPANAIWPPAAPVVAPAPLDPGLSPAPQVPAPAAFAGGPQDAWQATPALEMAQILSALHQAVAPAPLPRDGAPSPYPAAGYSPAAYPQPDSYHPQPTQPGYAPLQAAAHTQAEGGWHSPSVGPGFKRPNEGNFAAPRFEPDRQQTAWSAPVAALALIPAPSRPQGSNSNNSSNSSNSGDVGERAVQLAKQYIGTPYVWGGESPRGFDCSGLVQFVYDKLGVDIPRVAQDQAQVGQQVGRSNLAPGDLVYFRNTGNRTGITHIGMYAGDGKFIHAPKAGDVVKVSNLGDDYYQDHFAGATRIA